MVIDRSTHEFRLSGIFEAFVPLITTLVSIMITLLPIGSSPSMPYMPALGLISLFFWAMYRPSLLPPLVVFFIGLYHDLVSAGPLGLWTLTYLVFYGYFVERRTFYVGRTFQSLWFAFLVGVLIAGFVVWAVSSLFHMQVLSPLPVFVMGAVTLVAYPVWTRVLMIFNRMLSVS